jgi:hypothetical protein
MSALALFGGLLLLVGMTFRDYGITWDEPLHQRYGEASLAYYTSFGQDLSYYEVSRNLRADMRQIWLYGPLFDVGAAAVARISPLPEFETRHLLNALVGVLGIWGVYHLGCLLGSGGTGFLAALLLATVPSWYGHMFNNPKDIPFAAGYVWSLYFLLRLFLRFPDLDRAAGVKLGLAIGLSLGVRFGGLLLFAYLGLVLLFLLALHRDRLGQLLRVGATTGVVGWATMVALWPWTHPEPFRRPLAALARQRLGHDRAPGPGYLPTFFGVKLPELVLALLLVGLVLAAIELVRRAREPRAGDARRPLAIALLAVAAGFPVVYTMVRQPWIYDEIRHMLFVVPPLTCLAALAFTEFAERLPVLGRRIAVAVVAAGVLWTAIIMVRLHPNQYVYYNAFAGGLAGAEGRFPTDYWGNAMREATRELMDYLKSGAGGCALRTVRVWSSGHPMSTAAYLEPPATYVQQPSQADFLVVFAHYVGPDPTFVGRSYDGVPLFAVERLGVPLVEVRDRRALTHPGYCPSQEGGPAAP